MLTEFCVYTIVSRDKLDPLALSGAPLDNSETRRWTSAILLLQNAGPERSVPILLADAKDCSRLLYWGILNSAELTRTGTRYSVDRLRPLVGRRRPQELVLRSTGTTIAPGYIRPYAICVTPSFLADTSELPVLLPDEGISDGTMTEGAALHVTVNAYERNPAARRACIAHYGARCVVCAFDFEATYGEIGKAFIHVHHVVPLSRINKEYQVDPIRDLRPVCPNCHAMIHRTRHPMDISELTQRLKEQRNRALNTEQVEDASSSTSIRPQALHCADSPSTRFLPHASLRTCDTRPR